MIFNSEKELHGRNIELLIEKFPNVDPKILEHQYRLEFGRLREGAIIHSFLYEVAYKNAREYFIRINENSGNGNGKRD